MTYPLDDLQLYLLSQMSARALVESVTLPAGFTFEQLQAAKTSFAERGGFKDGASHALYEQFLGPFAVGKRAVRGDPASPFFGSIAHYYRLPLWPELLLQINRHPAGYAWGLTFVQDPTRFQPPQRAHDVRPWKFALDGLRSVYAWQEEDAWTDYAWDIYAVSSPENGVFMRGIFNLGVLQEWVHETTNAPRPDAWRQPTAMSLE
jgi:hypothetical protein